MEIDETLMKKAEKRVRDKAGFYVHFSCYLMVNIALIALWMSAGVFDDGTNVIALLFGPLFGWGVGIVAHFVAVFLGETDKAVQKEYKKLKNLKK
jgi:hypothetical protein